MTDALAGQVEIVARRLCLVEGLDPDQVVNHRYGDDFTAKEWETRYSTDLEVCGKIYSSPLWRLYRARAGLELSKHVRKVRVGGNIVAFKRRP